MSGRAIIFLLVTLTAFRRRSHQSRLQELLGPAAPGGGDAVQRRHAVRAVVGSARRLRAKLLVLLRRRRHRVLDLRARGAGAAGMAAAGLCRRRPLFGVTTSVLRMAFGGHFFTDVATAGLVTFLVIWLAYGYIYRWPPTRLTDEGIDAALTRLAALVSVQPARSRRSAVGRRCRRLNACPSAAKFDIRALNSLKTSAITTDWKFDEYDPEKPAQRGKSRHRLLGRSRHQRGAAVDEAKRRPRLCLYRQSRPARRGRLRRDSAQGAGVRRRKSPAGGLPHAIGPRRHCRHPVRRLPRLDRRHRPISTPRRSAAP